MRRTSDQNGEPEMNKESDQIKAKKIQKKPRKLEARRNPG